MSSKAPSRGDSEKQPINRAIEKSDRFYSMHIFETS